MVQKEGSYCQSYYSLSNVPPVTKLLGSCVAIDCRTLQQGVLQHFYQPSLLVQVLISSVLTEYVLYMHTNPAK